MLLSSSEKMKTAYLAAIHAFAYHHAHVLGFEMITIHIICIVLFL